MTDSFLLLLLADVLSPSIYTVLLQLTYGLRLLVTFKSPTRALATWVVVQRGCRCPFEASVIS